MYQLISKKQAIELGVTKYYTGKPCRRFHDSERFCKGGECVKCRILRVTSEYFILNKRLKAREKYRENIESIRAEKAEWRERNREKIKEYHKAWRDKNRDRVREQKSKRFKLRYHNDVEFKLECICREHLYRVLLKCEIDSKPKISRYSSRELMERLESTWTEGMSWDNYGYDGWHIDHIKPISVFIAEGETDPMVINGLENLQALWAFDNMSKGSRFREDD